MIRNGMMGSNVTDGWGWAELGSLMRWKVVSYCNYGNCW